MVWYNNPESVAAIQTAQREGYSTQRTRGLRLVNTQRQVDEVAH
jgi:hypothetical protein